MVLKMRLKALQLRKKKLKHQGGFGESPIIQT